MQKLYHETFEGHIKRGEFSLLTEEELNDNDGNFDTSVLLYKPDRVKTKLRICWNLSLKNQFGNSINQAVLPGMNLIKNLLNHLMNLRQNKYLLMADIEKAFLKIKYLPEYTKYFEILYARNLDKNPQLYKVLVVLFGLASSPFILNRTLMYHIQKIMAEEPSMAPFCIKLFEAFYLDDLGISFKTKAQAKQFVQNSIKILEMGNFNLTQWVATDPSILEGINKELIKPISNSIEMKNGTSMTEAPQTLGYGSVIRESSESLPVLESDSVSGLKCLGISYSPQNDTFFFEKQKLVNISEAIIETKRQLLATIPRIFDPLQVVSPLILKGAYFSVNAAQMTLS